MENIQEPCVTVMQEKWNSSTEKMSEKTCVTPYNITMMMGHQ